MDQVPEAGMRLAQYLDDRGVRAVAAWDGGSHRRVAGADSVHALALEAIAAGGTLGELVRARLGGETVDLARLEAEGRLLVPLDHPGDPAHMLMTGIGLSHLGSAEGRDK